MRPFYILSVRYFMLLLLLFVINVDGVLFFGSTVVLKRGRSVFTILLYVWYIHTLNLPIKIFVGTIKDVSFSMHKH